MSLECWVLGKLVRYHVENVTSSITMLFQFDVASRFPTISIAGYFDFHASQYLVLKRTRIIAVGMWNWRERERKREISFFYNNNWISTDLNSKCNTYDAEMLNMHRDRSFDALFWDAWYGNDNLGFYKLAFLFSNSRVFVEPFFIDSCLISTNV